MAECGGPLDPHLQEASHRYRRGVLGFELNWRSMSERLVDSPHVGIRDDLCERLAWTLIGSTQNGSGARFRRHQWDNGRFDEA